MIRDLDQDQERWKVEIDKLMAILAKEEAELDDIRNSLKRKRYLRSSRSLILSQFTRNHPANFRSDRGLSKGNRAETTNPCTMAREVGREEIFDRDPNGRI